MNASLLQAQTNLHEMQSRSWNEPDWSALLHASTTHITNTQANDLASQQYLLCLILPGPARQNNKIVQNVCVCHRTAKTRGHAKFDRKLLNALMIFINVHEVAITMLVPSPCFRPPFDAGEPIPPPQPEPCCGPRTLGSFCGPSVASRS